MLFIHLIWRNGHMLLLIMQNKYANLKSKNRRRILWVVTIL